MRWLTWPGSSSEETRDQPEIQTDSTGVEKVLVAPSKWESKAARLVRAALSPGRALGVGRVFIGGCESTVGKRRANGETGKKTLTWGNVSAIRCSSRPAGEGVAFCCQTSEKEGVGEREGVIKKQNFRAKEVKCLLRFKIECEVD